MSIEEETWFSVAETGFFDQWRVPVYEAPVCQFFPSEMNFN